MSQHNTNGEQGPNMMSRVGHRDCIEATGEDTTTFLQGQLSQDIAAMAIGASKWSLLLAPQGKVDAWLRVSRLEENRYILDVDAGHADVVITRLSRFLLRTKCELVAVDWNSVSHRGPDAVLDAAGADGQSNAVVTASAVGWAGGGVDLLGPDVALAPGTLVTDDAHWHGLRIISGIPMMGAELTADTIPAAAGIVDLSVSFTKGCYTGQELVARVDSRGGNVPHRLCVLRFEASVDVVPGAELAESADPEADAKRAGWVTSVGTDPSTGLTVALAYVARRVEVPATMWVAQFGADVTAQPTISAPAS